MHTKLTKDNVDTIYNGLRHIMSSDEYDQRFWHVGRFICIQRGKVIVERKEPENSELVYSRIFVLHTKRCKSFNVVPKLFIPKDYHLYQCRDGINIWTNEDIMPLDYIKLGNKTYLLLRSVERQNFPIKTEKGNYYEFRIREVI